MAETRTRAHRRLYDQLAKLRTVRKFKQWNATRNLYSWQKEVFESPGYIGKNAAVHCRGCSCFCCRNHKDIAPERERMFLDTLSESD